MQLLTIRQRTRLLANGRSPGNLSNYPVVKLFTPHGPATWLLSEIDPAAPDVAFGLVDLGHGFPGLSRVQLAELEGIRGYGGLAVARDRGFVPCRSLAAYFDDAQARGYVDA